MKKIITLITCLSTLTVVHCDPFNLIQNGDFSSGFEGWHLQNLDKLNVGFTHLGEGSAPDGDGAAINIVVEESNSEPWKLQLFQHGISLERDRMYELRFHAKGNKVIQIIIRDHFEPYGALDKVNSGRDILLDSEWKEFVYTFTSDDDVPSARITFDSLAVSGLDITLANVRLIPLE